MLLAIFLFMFSSSCGCGWRFCCCFSFDIFNSMVVRRAGPIFHVHRCFSLAQLLQQLVAFRARPHDVGLLTDIFCPFYDAILKGCFLFETPLLENMGAPFRSKKGGSAIGVLITDKSYVPGGDGGECVPEKVGAPPQR